MAFSTHSREVARGDQQRRRGHQHADPTAQPSPKMLLDAREAADEVSSFSSVSTMDSDYEIPAALTASSTWANERISTRVSQCLSGMAPIRESQAMRFSMVTANKWKKMGYHPYKLDSAGYTALHRAAKRRDGTVITSLLAMYDGKPLDLAAMKSTKQGQIALHIAARFGNLDAVRLLAAPEFRRLVNQPDNQGNTPLHFAVTSISPAAASITALLLLRGANPMIKSTHEVFPIVAHVLTTQHDDTEIIQLLLKYGSDPDTADRMGNTVLHVAVTRGLWNIAACLVRENASMSIRNNKGVMVLDVLSQQQLTWLAKHIIHPPECVPSAEQKACMVCSRRFNFLVRRRHCGLCGRICCRSCTKSKRTLPFVGTSLKAMQHSASHLANVCGTCICVRSLSEDEVNIARSRIEALIASVLVKD